MVCLNWDMRGFFRKNIYTSLTLNTHCKTSSYYWNYTGSLGRWVTQRVLCWEHTSQFTSLSSSSSGVVSGETGKLWSGVSDPHPFFLLTCVFPAAHHTSLPGQPNHHPCSCAHVPQILHGCSTLYYKESTQNQRVYVQHIFSCKNMSAPSCPWNIMCTCTRTIILLIGDSGAHHPADYSKQSSSSTLDHCRWLMNRCYEQDPLRIPGEQKDSPWIEGTQDALCHPGLTQCHSRQGPSIRKDARLLLFTIIPICHWII